MTIDEDVPRVAIQTSRGVVVASAQVEFEEPVLLRFQEDLLSRVHADGASGVILDLSGLETLDSHEFAALRRIAAMVDLLGAKMVLAGLRPGIVSALIECDVEVEGIVSALDLDGAFALLLPEPESTSVPEEDDAAEAAEVPDPPEDGQP